MRRLGIAAVIAAGCLGLFAWREISALNAVVSQISTKLEKVEIELFRQKLVTNLYNASVNTFGGYVCIDYCEKHFSGFSWASANNVKNENDCPLFRFYHIKVALFIFMIDSDQLRLMILSIEPRCFLSEIG